MDHEITKANPEIFLDACRFDVPAKYIYAHALENNTNLDFAYNLYKEHLKVWNDHKHGDGKDGIQEYVDTFKSLLHSIKTEGFNPEKSLVCVTKDLRLLNGGHRVAACLLYGKDIWYKIGAAGQTDVNYEYFKNKKDFVPEGLSEKWCDAIAVEYCKLKPNTFIVTIFPSAVGKRSEVESVIKEKADIFYKKTIQLSNEGPLNLMKELYYGEAWGKGGKSGYGGLKSKVNLCFRASGPTVTYIITVKNEGDERDIKNKVRKLFNIGNHSIHINDTKDQTIRLAKSLLNNNNIDHMNGLKQSKLPSRSKVINNNCQSVLFLWKDDRRILEEIRQISEIRYTKNIIVSEEGKYNLLDQIHCWKAWWKTHLIPETKKRIQDNEFILYILEGEDLFKKIREWKYKTRNKLGINKTYFHVSDPDCYKHLGQQCNCPVSLNDFSAECERHKNMLLHKNTFEFINQRTIKDLPKFDKFLKLYHNWLPNSHNDFCIDNGGSLGAYGIRDTHDLDFLYAKDRINTGIAGVDCHNWHFKDAVKSCNYDYNKNEIIYNPDLYFYHYGMKVCIIDIVKRIKEKRLINGVRREKDINDVLLISDFFKTNCE